MHFIIFCQKLSVVRLGISAHLWAPQHDGTGEDRQDVIWICQGQTVKPQWRLHRETAKEVLHRQAEHIAQLK